MTLTYESYIYNDRTKHIQSSAERLAQFNRNVMIYIENNPIVCNCDLYDFSRYMEEHPPTYQNNLQS